MKAATAPQASERGGIPREGPRLARVTPGLSKSTLASQLNERLQFYVKALAEMRKRLADPGYELSDCAGAFYMSERSLQRVFEEQGTNFSEQLHTLRMRLARRLLLDSHLKIAEIAHRVGYRQPSHFAKAYRRFHGHSPREERRRAGMPTRLCTGRRAAA